MELGEPRCRHGSPDHAVGTELNLLRWLYFLMTVCVDAVILAVRCREKVKRTLVGKYPVLPVL